MTEENNNKETIRMIMNRINENGVETVIKANEQSNLVCSLQNSLQNMQTKMMEQQEIVDEQKQIIENNQDELIQLKEQTQVLESQVV